MRLKLTIILTITTVLATSAFARRQETLIRGRIDHGYFGGMDSKFTTIDGEFELMLGGRGGWIIDHTFSVGLAGYGLISRTEGTDYARIADTRVDLGYGGVELAYIYRSNRLIHYEFSTLIGGGAIHYADTEDFEDDVSDDGFFVIEPGARAILNVTEFCRASLGLSYRFINSVDHEEILSDSELSGPSVSLELKFGSF